MFTTFFFLYSPFTVSLQYRAAQTMCSVALAYSNICTNYSSISSATSSLSVYNSNLPWYSSGLSTVYS